MLQHPPMSKRVSASAASDVYKRQDDNFRFQASLYYQFRRWINIELGYIYDERDSNRDDIDFGRNQFLINALFTL